MTAQNILVRAPNWIGDQILAYPFFYYLRQAYPQAHIMSACVGWVEDVQYQNLVDEVFVLEGTRGSIWDRFKSIENAAAQIRGQRQWDIGFSLPNSLSAAWLLWRSGARQRIGYNAQCRGLLLNSALKWDPLPTKHRAQVYVDLLRENSIKDFWKKESRQFDPKIAWPNAQPPQTPLSPFWVLAPGSSAESRRWPIEHVASLARLIVQKTDFAGVIVGGSAEQFIAQQLCQNQDLKLIDWTGRFKVSALWPLFREAKFSVSNDSGLAHVASLCGCPVYIAWGAGNPERTAPLGPGPVEIIFNQVECWPCERNECYQGASKHLQCLRGITPEMIWQKIGL